MKIKSILLFTVIMSSFLFAGCDEDDKSEAKALVSIKNDFNNPEMTYQPPWTICKSSYLGQEFGKISIGETSPEFEVTPGLDYVLMVAAWEDPDCNPENCLPIATKLEEEVVDGQQRVIAINMPNHQGSCPPEGVAPIPEEAYNRILALWPEYDFEPYETRTENIECLPDEE
ncbi:hypothetical protein KKF34_17480 [Myxococcota bacterium]|nr:hypothetical protein [Myxococcota bacterium]MBU1382463.1 hypothetical protein [Myxococcota bacterium]MBU1498674.1 hypothetical protein [Myxococcota bacterium]